MLAAIQGAGRWCFMRVEALFNLAFGERLNPLYYLGAISTWMFWLVVGTGVYLYVFFDTGVAGTWRSVDAITHEQWWAGGVMRSLHRYASDALVVMALLHLLREWAMDRMRGNHWFAWATGVPLLLFIAIVAVMRCASIPLTIPKGLNLGMAYDVIPANTGINTPAVRPNT